MAKSHPKNERIKHRYAAYLEDAKRMSPKTTEKALASIRQLELANSCKDFASWQAAGQDTGSALKDLPPTSEIVTMAKAVLPDAGLL